MGPPATVQWYGCTFPSVSNLVHALSSVEYLGNFKFKLSYESDRGSSSRQHKINLPAPVILENLSTRMTAPIAPRQRSQTLIRLSRRVWKISNPGREKPPPPIKWLSSIRHSFCAKAGRLPDTGKQCVVGTGAQSKVIWWLKADIWDGGCFLYKAFQKDADDRDRPPVEAIDRPQEDPKIHRITTVCVYTITDGYSASRSTRSLPKESSPVRRYFLYCIIIFDGFHLQEPLDSISVCQKPRRPITIPISIDGIRYPWTFSNFPLWITLGDHAPLVRTDTSLSSLPDYTYITPGDAIQHNFPSPPHPQTSGELSVWCDAFSWTQYLPLDLLLLELCRCSEIWQESVIQYMNSIGLSKMRPQD